MSLVSRILVGDANPESAEELVDLLKEAGHRTRRVGSGRELLEEMDNAAYDLVIVDVGLADMSALELLSTACERSPDLPIVIVTHQGKTALGVKAVRSGASDFLCKPFEKEEVLYVVGKTLKTTELKVDEPPSSMLLSQRSDMIGSSPAMKELEKTLRRAADGIATVLIRGESGTGKELVANRIHQKSPRANGPFVKLHCGALPDNLLESELFGYEKGAFTGATQRKPGRVELAQGGTLFLDEIGDITPAFQVKLLRLLQERTFERLGGTETLSADVRFVAATHRDLDAMVKADDFREDLFYRLNVVPLFVPPLRARPEDLDELAMHFARTVSVANGRGPMGLDAQALELIRQQKWPGNVRQLQNFIERLVVLAPGPRIGSEEVERELGRQAGMMSLVEEELPPISEQKPASVTTTDGEVIELAEAVKRAEKKALQKALKKAKGNRNLAARLLGVSRRTLYYKLQVHELN